MTGRETNNKVDFLINKKGDQTKQFFFLFLKLEGTPIPERDRKRNMAGRETSTQGKMFR